jgi:hypothetical protein
MDGLVRRRSKFVGAPLATARTDPNGCFGAPPNADRGQLHRDVPRAGPPSATATRARCFIESSSPWLNPPERTGLAPCVLPGETHAFGPNKDAGGPGRSGSGAFLLRTEIQEIAVLD